MGTRRSASRLAIALAPSLVAGCSDGMAPAMPERWLSTVGSSALTAPVNHELVLSVRVHDAAGALVSGAPVAWSTDAGSGEIVSSSPAISDAGGYATAVWRLGATAGTQRAIATTDSSGAIVQLAFTAVATAGPAASAALVSDSILLSARGETAYLSPSYRDAFGNATTATVPTWTSRSPAVATVAADGLVTAQSEGGTFVVLSFGTSTDSILVTVAMRGAITITFDDGFLTAYTNGFPLLDEVDLIGNVAVNPAQVGFAAYATKAHLDELHAAGWSIVSHTMTHDSLLSLSVGELDYELRASQQWIDAQGYRGSNVFIVPFHTWAARERDAVSGLYEAARGTSANAVSPDSLVAWKPSLPFDLTGIDAASLPYTTAEGRDRLRVLLQRTVDEGRFLDVYLHHLPPDNVDEYRAMLVVIEEFRERVLPYHELYPRFARTVD